MAVRYKGRAYYVNRYTHYEGGTVSVYKLYQTCTMYQHRQFVHFGHTFNLDRGCWADRCATCDHNKVTYSDPSETSDAIHVDDW